MQKINSLVIILLVLFIFLPTLSFAQHLPSQRAATAMVSSQTNEHIQNNKQQKANGAAAQAGQSSSLPSEAVFLNKKLPLPINATVFTEAEKKEKLPSNAAKIIMPARVLKPRQ